MSDDRTLLEKYCAVLRKVKNPPFDKKGHTGKNGSREYPYASLTACEKVVKEACDEEGVAFYYEIDQDDKGLWNVSTHLTDGKDKFWANPFPIKVVGTPQEIGSWITYARRYSLCATFAIVGEEDEDAQRIEAQTRQRQQRPTQRQPQRPSVPPKQAPRSQQELQVAVDRLNEVIERWCELNPDITPDQERAAIKAMPGYEKTPAFLNRVADGLEKQINDRAMATDQPA